MGNNQCLRNLTCDFLDGQTKINEGNFAGRSYYIVPSVMLVEGAFTPAVDELTTPTALYFNGDDIAMSVQSWNGRPVSLYHPVGNTSCNIPHVLDGQLLGYLFGAQYDQVEKKLRADLWLDKDRGEFIIDKIRLGDKIELSVGAYGDIVSEKGTYGDTKYSQRMTNIVGDHLAVLPDVPGACGWEDGCGIRMSKEQDQKLGSFRLLSRNPSYSSVEDSSWESVDKGLHNYIKAFYSQAKGPEEKNIPSTVIELSSEAKKWIASKSLLGNVEAETAEDLLCFPVVSPNTNRLNKNALNVVLSGTSSEAKIPAGSMASAVKTAERLLESEFTKKEKKMDKDKVKVEVNACKPAPAKEEAKAPVTMNDVLATAPKELRGAIADAMREREEQRKSLVTAIDGYEKVSFCPDFLEKIETKELKAIASLVSEASKEKAVETKVDYSLKSGVEMSDKKRCSAPSLF